jgi:N-acyl-L-homoserine lactone synthetase
MIKLFSGTTRHHHLGAMDEMFRLRKRVFHDLL